MDAIRFTSALVGFRDGSVSAFLSARLDEIIFDGEDGKCMGSRLGVPCNFAAPDGRYAADRARL